MVVYYVGPVFLVFRVYFHVDSPTLISVFDHSYLFFLFDVGLTLSLLLSPC